MKLSQLSQALAVISAFVILHGTKAQQVLPFYEPFPASYTNGSTTVLTVQGVTDLGRNYSLFPANQVWTLGGGDGSGTPACHPGATLTYPGLWSQSEPNLGLFVTNTMGGNRIRGIEFPATSSNKLYASFLLNVVSAPTGNRLVTFLGTNTIQYTSSQGAVMGIFVNANTELLVSKNSSTTPSSGATTALNVGTTNLVVVRYTFNPTAATDDEFALWVNPSQASFAAPEPNVPAPNVFTTNGIDGVALVAFFVQSRNTTSSQGANLLLDEIRIGTNWAHVTPTNELCVSARLTADPTNKTTAADISARFSVNGGGTRATYQWQVSTDNGATWNNVIGATNKDYDTPNNRTTDNGKKYRAIITVPCDATSVTSAPATLTVLAPVYTPLGLIVDDFWLDGDRTSGPVATNNSMWFASEALTLIPGIGSMSGYPVSASSRLWVGYFTDDVTKVPVHLDVGRTIKSTLKFSPDSFNSFTNGGNSLRFGLFDYADGATRLTSDDFGTGSTGNGRAVRGYMLIMNWGQTFTEDTPFEILARTFPDDNNLMGAGGPYTSLGSGPEGTFSNTPAFQAGTTYTLEFSVARAATNMTIITAKMTGGSLNYSFTTNDYTWAFPRYDAYGIRPNTLESTADSFTFKEFRVEILTNAIVLPPVTQIPINAQLSGNNVILTWSNPAFALQAAPEATGTYTNVPGATSPYTNAISTSRKFFRLFAP